jgi:hypothetical protein
MASPVYDVRSKRRYTIRRPLRQPCGKRRHCIASIERHFTAPDAWRNFHPPTRASLSFIFVISRATVKAGTPLPPRFALHVKHDSGPCASLAASGLVQYRNTTSSRALAQAGCFEKRGYRVASGENRVGVMWLGGPRCTHVGTVVHWSRVMDETG